MTFHNNNNNRVCRYSYEKDLTHNKGEKKKMEQKKSKSLGLKLLHRSKPTSAGIMALLFMRAYNTSDFDVSLQSCWDALKLNKG